MAKRTNLRHTSQEGVRSGPSRRDVLKLGLGTLGVTMVAESAKPNAAGQTPYNAMGERVGEVTHQSAIVHTRLTKYPARNVNGYRFAGAKHGTPVRKIRHLPPDMSVNELEGACPGRSGVARLWLGRSSTLEDARAGEWKRVDSKRDYTQRFVLDHLEPETTYYYAVEMAGEPGARSRRGAIGKFQTAPLPDRWHKVMFAISTCEHYVCQDHPEGYRSYLSMKKLDPAFLVSTGDSVYYDNEPPFANTVSAARFHWHRMYSLPSIRNFFQTSPGYWMKDDHDTLCNDCWPAMNPPRSAPLTFSEGQQIFLDEVPVGERTYRHFRWGKGIEIWMLEGRDFRSPNTMPDGPQKTIWGAKQKDWFKRTILQSDADFLILISPDPIVGPDRKNKADNHSNAAFATEGDEIRQWIQHHRPNNVFVTCGDRHWQYFSIDPKTGVREFCCGPVSDAHAEGCPGYNHDYHWFLREKGGFLTVSLEGSEGAPRLVFRHHDVDGNSIFRQEFSRSRA
jgi:alkaline phosphatase D